MSLKIKEEKNRKKNTMSLFRLIYYKFYKLVYENRL